MNSFLNWGFKYEGVLRKKPSSWLLVIVLTLLPSPTQTVLFSQKPLIRDAWARESASISRYPVLHGKQPPTVTARSVYIIDTDSMVPLFMKRQDEPIPPASTTKILTALVAIDAFNQDDIMTTKDASKAIGKAIHLSSGERISFEDMLYGLLLESGNDAAYALAENYSGGYEGMINAMVQKSKELGLRDSAFQNVSGVDQLGHRTTAHDLAMLSASAMKQPLFRTIVNTRQKVIRSLDGKIVHRLSNTNELLDTVEGVKGIKTGWTERAGECLITAVGRSGHNLIIILMGSQDRFGETTELIDWIFENHEWKSLEIN